MTTQTITTPAKTRRKRKAAIVAAPAVPVPVPEALQKLVKRRPPRKKKLLEQSLILSQVRVRRNRLTHKWAVVDEADQVVLEADTLVLSDVTMEEVADEDCVMTRVDCGYEDKIETQCVRGWMRGKLLGTDKPATYPAGGEFRVDFTRDPDGTASHGFYRPSGFSCARTLLERGTRLHTAGYVVLHDDGKASAYYPNQPPPAHAKTEST